MPIEPSPRGDLLLGHVLVAAGLDPARVIAIRHTYKDDGLTKAASATLDGMRFYTRVQAVGNKVPKSPPRIWLVFMADGKRRSRFLTAYENKGEIAEQRTDTLRCFDLHETEALLSLRDRLVIDWSSDTINWAKSGRSASEMRVVEIADPSKVPFPGLDRVVIDYDELQAVVEDSRYAEWRTALSAVQGIYLIADRSTGKLYVGKADGVERIFGRWTAYARDGHGGNVELRALMAADPHHCRHFVYSILRVFGPSATAAEVNAAEVHYKRSMLTVEHGLNGGY